MGRAHTNGAGMGELKVSRHGISGSSELIKLLMGCKCSMTQKEVKDTATVLVLNNRQRWRKNSFI